MIQPTSTDLIKHILANPKDAKAIAKVMLEAPSAVKSNLQTPLAQTLLNALSKGETTPANVRQTLEATPWVKHAPTLVQEIKNLTNILKQDPNLKTLAQSFDKILNNSQPNSTSSPQMLQSRLENSGLHYEATLKQSIPSPTISPQGKTVIDALLKLFPKAPLLPSAKEILQPLAKELLNAPTPQKAQSFMQNLSTAIQQSQTQLSKNHPLLNLSKNIFQLQQILNSLNSKANLPNPQLTQAKQSNLNQTQSVLANQSNQQTSIQQHAKTILTKLDSALPILRAAKIPAQTIQEVRTALLQIANSPMQPQPKAQYNTQNIPLHVNQSKTPNISTIPSPTSNQSTQQPINPAQLNFKTVPSTPTNTAPLAPNIKQNIIPLDSKALKPPQAMPMYAILTQLQSQPLPSNNQDLQTRLAQAVTRLQNIIQQADAMSMRLPAAFSRLENLQTQIRPHLLQLTTPLPNMQESTIHDAKRALLEIQQHTNGKESPVAREANSLATKALGQLDFHQLYSYVSQQTHTYLPYFWDGLQGGALQFKRDSERTYCKIDLEFEKYDRVQILIGLFEQHYITLTVGVEHPELYSRISNHLKALRGMLNSVGLIPQSITLLPTLQEMPYENFAQEDAFGFDFKV